MIIPMVCFTCGKPISHLYNLYLELVEKYSKIDKPTAVFKALADLKIGTDCCRRMFITHHDMFKEVNQTYLGNNL